MCAPSPMPLSRPQVNLLRGWPSPSLLPARLLKEASQEVLSDPSIYVPSLQYGPELGYQPLREELARWLGELYRVPADAGRLCITGGASQNLACILQSFTDPGYTVAIWMAAPCYYLACPIFADAGFAGRLKAVPEDDDGIDLSYLEKAMLEAETQNMPDKPVFKNLDQRKVYRHVIYVVPSCSNPTGKSLSLERRTSLVHLARKYNSLVVCDDVYDFLQWPTSSLSSAADGDCQGNDHVALGPLLPRLCDIERRLGPTEDDDQNFGHAVSNGSFSKIVGPGMRTGWAEATPAFSYGLSQTGSTRSGGSPSQLAAFLAWRLLASGDLDNHLSKVTRPGLQRRHHILTKALRALQEQIGDVDISICDSNTQRGHVYGGYFVWIKLPKRFDAAVVADHARKHQNLIVGHGAMFEVHGDEASATFRNHIRLCFSWESEENITEGVTRLLEALRGYNESAGTSADDSPDEDKRTQ